MTSKLNKTVAALTAAAVLAPAGAALAADSTTVDSVDIKGAYAYIEKNLTPHKTYAAVVFKTSKKLPRRYDGMLRASGSLDGTGHSIASVKGKNSRCYTFLAEIKDGKIRGLNGKRANVGSKHTLVVSARGTDGDLTDHATVTLRKKRAGDASGKPLGC
jgi:hypothetical protein